jgi:PTH1 family peptidyl-tRNA hydrolase
MSADPLLIVGLANPGKEYEKTRHNAGAWLVEALANEANVNLRLDPKFHGFHAFTKLHGCPAHLLIPTTFMNRSGLSIQAVMGFYKLKPEQVLVAHDEIDLPAGVIRLKFDGGDGGHNGLKDTIRHLNSRQFYRLRIGVGRPAPGHDVADYVLNNPSKADRALIDDTIARAVNVMPLVLEGKMQAAMQALHTV